MKSDDDDAVPESLPLRLTHPVSDSPSAARADGDPLHPAEVYPTQPDMVRLYEVSWTIYGGGVVTHYLSMAGRQKDVTWHCSWSEYGIEPQTMSKLGFGFFPKQDFTIQLDCEYCASEPYPLKVKASRTYTLGRSWEACDGQAPECGWEARVMGEKKVVGYMYEDTVAELYFFMPRTDSPTLITDPHETAAFSWYRLDGTKRSYKQWRHEKPRQVSSTP